MPFALIVEDDPEANKLLAMLLKLRGYETQSAFQGAQAIQFAKVRMPDVVFLDLMLPDMDGYEVCRLLKAEASITEVPVVIVTARIAAENRIESFRVGADDYVPKPYTPDEIFESLDVLRTPAAPGSSELLEECLPLDMRDDGQTLRGLSRLRRSVTRRKILNPARIAAVGEVIKLLWSSADRWSRQHHCEQVADLDYRLGPDQLLLLISDHAGWLDKKSLESHDLNSASQPAWLTLARSAFDEIDVDPIMRTIRLRFSLNTAGTDSENSA